jgi:hypothetical protein
MLLAQAHSQGSRKFLGRIFALCLLSLTTLTMIPGCKTGAVNPAQAKANTGYVDFSAPGQGDLYWQVRQYDEKAGAFKTVFSRLKPLDGPILRLATPPGHQRFQITFLNRVVENPATVDVEVLNGMITPVRVELIEVGSTKLERREARLGYTVRRFEPGARVTSSEASAYDVLAKPQPSVPYRKKASAHYPQ